jgi:hypothetical protein
MMAGSSFPPVVCMRAHVVFVFVFVEWCVFCFVCQRPVSLDCPILFITPSACTIYLSNYKC